MDAEGTAQHHAMVGSGWARDDRLRVAALAEEARELTMRRSRSALAWRSGAMRRRPKPRRGFFKGLRGRKALQGLLFLVVGRVQPHGVGQSTQTLGALLAKLAVKVTSARAHSLPQRWSTS